MQAQKIPAGHICRPDLPAQTQEDFPDELLLGARRMSRTTPHASKKGSEKVPGKGSGEGFLDEGPRSYRVHHAIAFAIASEFCRKHPFARNFRSEDDIFAISFAKPFALSASELIRSA